MVCRAASPSAKSCMLMGMQGTAHLCDKDLEGLLQVIHPGRWRTTCGGTVPIQVVNTLGYKRQDRLQGRQAALQLTGCILHCDCCILQHT